MGDLTKWKVGAWGIQSQPLDRVHPSADKSWAPIPGIPHSDESVEGDMVGLVGECQNNLFKCSMHDKATTFHVSLHLWVWTLTSGDC